MRNLIIITFLAMIVSLDAFSAITLKKIDFKSKKSNGEVVMKYSGDLNEYPELKVTKSTVQVYFPESKVTSTFNKKVKFSSEERDTRLEAQQISSNVSKIKISFPFNIKKYEDNVELTLKNNKVILTFPRVKVKASVAKKKKTKVDTKKFDEEYLNNLLAVKGEEADTKKEKKIVKKILPKETSKTVSVKKSFFNDERESRTQSDVIKTTLASVKKSTTPKGSEFSFAGYAGKFIVFLLFVLALFYGIVNLLKKGVTKKGKLGFLNNTNLVEVISTTYVAPKKSLLMVKAHNQVFLVGNSDQGMQLISEINDVPGIVKTGEKEITGGNFDTNITSAGLSDLDSKVKIKENIMVSDTTPVKKDTVKFSDQIKMKVKKMKDLQQ